MRIYVVYLNLMPMYLINYELLNFYDNEFDRLITQYLFNFVEAMNIISYFRASWRRPKTISITIPSDGAHACQICKNWKPERAHHCSICD